MELNIKSFFCPTTRTVLCLNCQVFNINKFILSGEVQWIFTLENVYGCYSLTYYFSHWHISLLKFQFPFKSLSQMEFLTLLENKGYQSAVQQRNPTQVTFQAARKTTLFFHILKCLKKVKRSEMFWKINLTCNRKWHEIQFLYVEIQFELKIIFWNLFSVCYVSFRVIGRNMYEAIGFSFVAKWGKLK